MVCELGNTRKITSSKSNTFSAFDILKQIFVQIGSGNINLSSISYF